MATDLKHKIYRAYIRSVLERYTSDDFSILLNDWRSATTGTDPNTSVPIPMLELSEWLEENGRRAENNADGSPLILSMEEFLVKVYPNEAMVLQFADPADMDAWKEDVASSLKDYTFECTATAHFPAFKIKATTEAQAIAYFKKMLKAGSAPVDFGDIDTLANLNSIIRWVETDSEGNETLQEGSRTYSSGATYRAREVAKAVTSGTTQETEQGIIITI